MAELAEQVLGQASAPHILLSSGYIVLDAMAFDGHGLAVKNTVAGPWDSVSRLAYASRIDYPALLLQNKSRVFGEFVEYRRTPVFPASE